MTSVCNFRLPRFCQMPRFFFILPFFKFPKNPDIEAYQDFHDDVDDEDDGDDEGTVQHCAELELVVMLMMMVMTMMVQSSLVLNWT